MKIQRMRAALATAFVAALLTLPAGPATAAEDDSQLTRYGTGEHCSLNLDTDTLVCADSEAALGKAVYDATGLELVKSATAIPEADVSPMATYIIGIIYRGANYSGGSLNVTVSNTCVAGWQFNYYNLTSIGWNDDIEFWKSYAGCRTSVWEHANEGGAKLGPYTNRTTLGVLANNASSIRWAP